MKKSIKDSLKRFLTSDKKIIFFHFLKETNDVYEVSANIERDVKRSLAYLLKESEKEKDLKKRQEEEERKKAMADENLRRIESEERLKAEKERINKEKRKISLQKRRAGRFYCITI